MYNTNTTQKQTIQQTTEQLKEFFQTDDITYQAKVGYFVHTSQMLLRIKETNDFLISEIGLTINSVRAAEANHLVLFLEKA